VPKVRKLSSHSEAVQGQRLYMEDDSNAAA